MMDFFFFVGGGGAGVAFEENKPRVVPQTFSSGGPDNPESLPMFHSLEKGPP